MSEAGYTLAEALAALVILGLAVGGVTAATTTLGRMQGAVARDLREGGDDREAGRAFSNLLATGGSALGAPSGALKGAARRLQFDCGRTSACGAELRRDAKGLKLALTGAEERDLVLPRAAGDAHFIYIGALTSGEQWPPAKPGAGERLRAVAVVDEDPRGDTPLAVAHIWPEQPFDCAFDPISRDCRTQ